jgi:LysM domain-containing protein
MMPTSMKSLLATAAVLALAAGAQAPMPVVAQEEHATAESAAAPSTAPAPAAPAAHPAPAKRAVPAAEPAPTAPPRNLKKVGDHWTPYSPPDPESLPPDATLHIIAPGETLWGLADMSYNNPWLWPQLWDQNRYITDSHWIYPGDPLLVPPRPVVVTPTGEGVPTTIVPQGQEGAPATELEPMNAPEDNEAVEEPLGAETPAPTTAPEPTRPTGAYPGGVSPSASIVDRDEIRCSGYIVEDDERGDLYIAENDEPIYDDVTVGSLLYLNRGKNDPRVVPGAVFSVVEGEGTVLHPVTGRTEGNYYRRSGEVRVLKVLDDTALATVTFACDEIRVGDNLVPVETTTVPNRPIPPFDRLRVERNGKPTGYVIHAKDSAVNPATGDMVQLDLGKEDGVAPGDFLTAFVDVRANRAHSMPDYHYTFNNMVHSRPDLHVDDGRDKYPEVPVGQLIIVTTAAHTSTAKIVYATREIAVGSMVEVY